MPSVKLGNLVQTFANLAAMDDGSLEDVQAKEKRYAELVGSTGYQSARLLADAWCRIRVEEGQDHRRLHHQLVPAASRPPPLLPWMKDDCASATGQFPLAPGLPRRFQCRAMKNAGRRTGWNGGFDHCAGKSA